MENLVRIKIHPPSGTIILDRADKGNALTRLMLLQLQQAFEDLHQQRNVRAVILTGAGNVFCAGADMAEIHATYAADDVLEQWHRDTLQYREILEYMLRFPKPIIAAVNGPAAGAGAGLVLASDIVLSSPLSRFGLPEPRRGIVAGISSPLLAFRIGAGRAANLLLTGRLIAADEALQMGIYHKLVAFELLWAAAHRTGRAVCRILFRSPATDQAHAERNDRRATWHAAFRRCGCECHVADNGSRRRGHHRLRGKTRAEMAVTRSP